MPDIPSGKEQMALGEGLMNLAEGLSRLGARREAGISDEQKVFIAAGAREEFMVAAMALDKWTNERYEKAKVDPDLSTVIDRWNTELPEKANEILKGIKLPAAKMEFQKYLVDEADKSTELIGKVVNERELVRIETTARDYRGEIAMRGQVTLLQQEWGKQVATGVVSDVDRSDYEKNILPLARRQAALNDLSVVDYDTAIQATLANDFGRMYELDANGVETVRKTVIDRKESATKLAGESLKKSQDSIYADFVKQSVDPTTQPSRSQAAEMKVALIGHNGFSDVDNYIVALDMKAEYDKTHAIEIGRSNVYVRLATQLQNWNGNADTQPWNFNSIEKLHLDQGPNGLDEPDYDKLKNDLEQALKDIASGSRKGPNYLDPAKYAEFITIVNDDKMLPAEKNERIKKYQYDGVPPDKWQAGKKGIDELNDRDDWRQELSYVNNLYSPQVNAMVSTDPGRAKKVQEWSEATQAMIKLFRLFPNAPDKWIQGRRTLLDPAIKKAAVDGVVKELNRRFFGIFKAGISDAAALEAAAERLPTFQATPALVVARSMESENIRVDEEKALTAKGITVADKYQDPKTGFWLYSSVPIPRSASGIPIWSDPSLKGKTYEVRTEIVNGERVDKVYAKAVK